MNKLQWDLKKSVDQQVEQHLQGNKNHEHVASFGQRVVFKDDEKYHILNIGIDELFGGFQNLTLEKMQEFMLIQAKTEKEIKKVYATLF